MHKFEYIWVDGGDPTATIRSKTKIAQEITPIPTWGFDGSSTNQASGDASDCVLKPVRVYMNPLETQSSLVLCEVMNVDETPHATNTRTPLVDIVSNNIDEPLVGIEQEYTLFKEGRPLGWSSKKAPPPQGDYYCGRNKGENIARHHMEVCLKAGIAICGINSEVMLGQWEYQIGTVDPLRAADDLWVARWILEKIASFHDVTVSLNPKPMAGDWNGAGCHTNFSTKEMREDKGIYAINRAIESLEAEHNAHIEVYGADNDKRLTGLHETCPIADFKAGVSDRGCSIRIPWQVAKEEKGYLEDRRPASNCDPYRVCWRIIKTICQSKETENDSRS